MNPREAKRANKLSTDTSTPTTRLRESPARTLGAFLRRMRDRATPLDARRGSRRRAAGLRREEVSQAAGISVTWYTWLEQGRDVRVSPRALNAIADALRLDATERDHLLRLADAAHATRASSITQVASEQLVRFVDALSHPAYAINGMWDVLHANRAATALLGEFRPEHPTGNVLTRLFLDPAWQRLFHPRGRSRGVGRGSVSYRDGPPHRRRRLAPVHRPPFRRERRLSRSLVATRSRRVDLAREDPSPSDARHGANALYVARGGCRAERPPSRCVYGDRRRRRVTDSGRGQGAPF